MYLCLHSHIPMCTCVYVHTHPCVMEQMSAHTSYDSVSVTVDSACLSVSVGPGGCVCETGYLGLYQGGGIMDAPSAPTPTPAPQLLATFAVCIVSAWVCPSLPLP